jgi:fibronectin type 3 domain-containing protein
MSAGRRGVQALAGVALLLLGTLAPAPVSTADPSGLALGDTYVFGNGNATSTSSHFEQQCVPYVGEPCENVPVVDCQQEGYSYVSVNLNTSFGHLSTPCFWEFLQNCDGSAEGLVTCDDLTLAEDGTLTFQRAAGNGIERTAHGTLARSNPQPPGAPTLLTADAEGSQVTLTWSVPADGGQPIQGYLVYGRGGTQAYVGIVGWFTGTSATLSRSCGQWTYLVRAESEVDDGPYSGPRGVPDWPGPVPRARASSGPGPGVITLTWDPPACGDVPIAHYNIHRGDTSRNETLYQQVGNVTTFEDSGVPGGAKRYYVVSAVNADGTEGRLDFAQEASATAVELPSAPSALSASPGDQRVSLTWSAPSSNGGSSITGYKLYRGTSSGGESFVANLGNVTSTADTGLTNGQAYYYKVSAVNAAGEGPRSGEAAATPSGPPSAPRGLAATRGDRQVQLAWQAPSNDGGSAVTGYKLYRGTTSGGESFLTNLSTATSTTDTGLTNGQAYYYQLAAVSSAGEGARSAEASATPATLPDAPRSLAASRGPGAGQITLTWQAPASNGGAAITGYRVYRGDSSGSEALLQQVGSVLTFTDTGIPAGATRYYQVSAVNAVGEGSASGEASGSAPVAPSAPASLAAARGPGAGQITLTWPAPGDGGSPISGYRVYRGDASGGEAFLASTGTTLSYVDSGLPNGVTRCYQLSAVNAAGEGPRSPEACAFTSSPPGPPRSLAGSPALAFSLQGTNVYGGVALRWDAPLDNGGAAVTAYLIYHATAPGQEQFLQQVGNVLSYTDNHADLLRPNYYTVRAVNGVGTGPASNEACAYTYPWIAPLYPPLGRCA